jgi:hypothetical protein
MVEASYDTPSWDLAMARKDARLMQEAAAAAGVELVALPGIAARMDAEIAAGCDGRGAVARKTCGARQRARSLG